MFSGEIECCAHNIATLQHAKSLRHRCARKREERLYQLFTIGPIWDCFSSRMANFPENSLFHISIAWPKSKKVHLMNWPEKFNFHLTAMLFLAVPECSNSCSSFAECFYDWSFSFSLVKWFRRFSFTSFASLTSFGWGFFFAFLHHQFSFLCSFLACFDCLLLLSTHSNRTNTRCSQLAINWNSMIRSRQCLQRWNSSLPFAAALCCWSFYDAIEFHFVDDSSPHLIVYIILFLAGCNFFYSPSSLCSLLRPKLEKREAARWRGEKKEEWEKKNRAWLSANEKEVKKIVKERSKEKSWGESTNLCIDNAFEIASHKKSTCIEVLSPHHHISLESSLRVVHTRESSAPRWFIKGIVICWTTSTSSSGSSFFWTRPVCDDVRLPHLQQCCLWDSIPSAIVCYNDEESTISDKSSVLCCEASHLERRSKWPLERVRRSLFNFLQCSSLSLRLRLLAQDFNSSIIVARHVYALLCVCVH